MLNQKIKNKIAFPILFLISFIFACVLFLNISIDDFEVIQNSVEKNIESIKLDEQELFREKFVTLNVLKQTYKIEIENKDTVYDAMEILDNSTNNFSFNSKKYSGLGIFINEINGVKGRSGAYWIYYINGEKVSVGVSKYILKSEDVITWKQE